MNPWLSMSIRNAIRRKLRTLVTAAGVAIGTAALCSLIAFERSYQAGIQGELDRLGAQILVAPKGCPYDAASMALHGASWPCYLKQDYLARVKASAGVASAAPVLMNAVYDDTSGAQWVYQGVDPEILALKRGWRIRGALPATTDECLLGATSATRLKLNIGDKFPLPGLPAGQTGTVSGVLNTTGDADDTFIFTSIARAQAIFNRPRQLTHILVRLKDPNMLDNVVADLRGCDAGMDMNVVPLAHVFHTIQDLINSTRILLGCVALIAMLAAGAGVSNAVLMAVSERTSEIGMMRAVGASKADVFLLIWLETMSLCVLGAAVGIVVSASTAPALERWLRSRLPISPENAFVHLDAAAALLCLGLAAVLGTVACLIPAIRAVRLSPVEALRSGAHGG